MASHSPAPWEYHPAPYGWDVWAATPEKFRQWITPVTRLASPHKAIFDGSIEVDAETCEANARLIAAAPEMLAALRLAFGALSNPEIYTNLPVGGVRIAIADAIAKAEGPDLNREVS